MRIRHVAAKEKIELQMTPMIDIVFQLLVFFVMTFKIGAMEGDFNIKMPAAAPSQGTPDDEQLPPMTLRLTSDARGQLTGIQLNDIGFGSFDELHRHVMGIVGTEAGPGLLTGAEIELDCDYHLRYEAVINAITAVLGHKAEDGSVVKLIEKIRFAPPREE
jgi:biopolymer transport protein ExbD